MSMKRSKGRTFGAQSEASADDKYFKKKVAVEKTFDEEMDGKTDDMFAAFSMTTTYEKGALLTHPKFGKGVVTFVEGPRIEVLFADGKKKLGHASPA